MATIGRALHVHAADPQQMPSAQVRACFPSGGSAQVVFTIVSMDPGVTTASFVSTGQAGDTGQRVTRNAGPDGCATAEITGTGFGTVTVRATRGQSSVTTIVAVGTPPTATAAPPTQVSTPASPVTPTVSPTASPSATPAVAAPASANVAPPAASLIGQFTLLPSSTLATCAEANQWTALYWRGGTRSALTAIQACPKADRLWVRRETAWLGVAPGQTAGSDQFDLEYGELVFMHGAP
jgi:hypothetical protein